MASLGLPLGQREVVASIQPRKENVVNRVLLGRSDSRAPKWDLDWSADKQLGKAEKTDVSWRGSAMTRKVHPKIIVF